MIGMKPKIVVLGTMILIAFFLVSLLALQNYHLKSEVSQEGTKYKKVIERYKFHLEIYRQLVNQIFPLDANKLELHFLDLKKFSSSRKKIFMVFNLTTCGQCVMEEFKLLHSMKDEIELKEGYIVAIIGIANPNEKSDVLQQHLTGSLPFPFGFVEDEVIDKLTNANKSTYLDTPIYFLVDRSFKIEDVFKPDAQELNTLKVWINNVLNNGNYESHKY